MDHRLALLGLCVAALMTGLASAVPASAQDMGLEWQAMAPRQSSIVFYAPGLETQRARYLRTETANYSAVYEVAFWSGLELEHHKAVVRYVKLAPDYLLRGTHHPERLIAEFTVFKDKDLSIGSDGEVTNPVGPVRFQLFSYDDVGCVTFLQEWGFTDHRAGGRTRRLSGYYCGHPGEPLDETAAMEVLQLLGIKGVGVPKPPPRMAAKPKRRTVPLQVEVEGESTPVSGAMTLKAGAKQGDLLILMPAPQGDCRGAWRYVSHGAGVWDVVCNDGLTVKGSYQLVSEGKGKGRGETSDSRIIAFTYSFDG